MEWVRNYRWPVFFGLVFALAASGAIWLWETGQLTSSGGEKTTLEVELNALKALHEENNQLQAEIVSLKEELTQVANDVTEANAKIAGARTSVPSVSSGSAVSTTSDQATVGQTVSGTLNINTADQAQLETLPGIGPSKATAIIEYRIANGPFSTPNSIANVKGIGEKTYEQLAPLIVTQ